MKLTRKQEKMGYRIFLFAPSIFLLAIYSAALIYSIEQMGEHQNIKELLFWAGITLMFMLEMFPSFTHIVEAVEGIVLEEKNA